MNATRIEEASSETESTTLTIEIPIAQGESAAAKLSWVVRNFLWTVCDTNLIGDVRRLQAHKLCIDAVVKARLKNQINDEEGATIAHELSCIEEQVYPGSSKT